MAFNPESLRLRLDKLPPRHRTLFAAACSERLWPNYVAFAREAEWGNPAVLRAALDYIWDVLESGVGDRGEIDNLIEQCDLAIPDTDDFHTSSVSAALDAGTAVVGTLRSLLDGDPQHIVEVASYCRDTVYMYIQDRDDLDCNVPSSDTRIAEDPLMRRELERQDAILSDLVRNPDLDGAFLKRLRDESADGGRSNIGRMVRDPLS